MNTSPKAYYDHLVSTITDMDKRVIARALSFRIGKENAISKRDLVIRAFGSYTTATERKTRDIIADLITEDHFTVCALSGEGGYYVAANHDEAVESARELESRIEKMSKRAKALRMCSLPSVTPEERAQKSQLSLL